MSFETSFPHRILAAGAKHDVEQRPKSWRVLLDLWICYERASALLARVLSTIRPLCSS